MIYSLRSLMPSAGVATQTREGLWVAAVPLPYYPNILTRLRDAWAVFAGRAVAARYPEPGEFEMALQEGGWKIGG